MGDRPSKAGPFKTPLLSTVQGELCLQSREEEAASLWISTKRNPKAPNSGDVRKTKTTRRTIGPSGHPGQPERKSCLHRLRSAVSMGTLKLTASGRARFKVDLLLLASS
jgi:hypothetical protein